MPGGRERRGRHPRPTILQTQLPAPGPPGGDRDRLAEAQAVPSGVGAATGSRGQLEALIPVPLTPIKAQNRYSCRVGDSEATRKGSSTAGRGHAIRIPPSRPEAPIRQTRRGPATARCRTDLGRQCDSAEEGAWPLGGVPSDASPTPRLGDRPTLGSDQGGQRPGDIPGLSPSGGPGCPTAALVSGDRAGSVRPPEVAKAQVPGLGPGERPQGPVCQDGLTPCPLARHSRTKGACSPEVSRLSCHPRRHTHGQLGQWDRRPAAPPAEPGP
jgi:hypothetical protein